MGQMCVLFVRHGKPTYTKEELEAGTLEGTLTPEGVEQIRKTAGEIVGRGWDKSSNVLIMHSPKRRARESMGVIRDALTNAGVSVKAEENDALRDVRFSVAFLDKQYEDVTAGRSTWDKWMKYWMEFHDYDAQTDSPEQVKDRAQTVLARIADLADTERYTAIVVVGHEEGVSNLLLDAFGLRTEDGAGPSYAEMVEVALSTSDRLVNMTVKYRGQAANLIKPRK